MYFPCGPGGGGYSHTLPIRVCAAQRGRDFEAPDYEVSISEAFSRMGYVTPQNVIIAAKCNINAKCKKNRHKM